MLQFRHSALIKVARRKRQQRSGGTSRDNNAECKPKPRATEFRPGTTLATFDSSDKLKKANGRKTSPQKSGGAKAKATSTRRFNWQKSPRFVAMRQAEKPGEMGKAAG